MTRHRQYRAQGIMALCAALVLASCASVDPELIREKEGFLYGSGSAATIDEAEKAAKQDLISRAMGRSAAIDAETVEALHLKTKTVATRKTDGVVSVALRVSIEDWEESRGLRKEELREEGRKILSRLKLKASMAEDMDESAAYLDRLAKEGLANELSLEKDSRILMKDAIKATLLSTIHSLRIEIEPQGALIAPDGQIEIRLIGVEGEGVPGMQIRATWQDIEENILPHSDFILRTGPLGEAELLLSKSTEKLEGPLVLRLEGVYPDFGFDDPSAFTDALHMEAKYIVSSDILALFGPFTDVEAGEFQMGASSAARSVPKRETARMAQTGAYRIAHFPITNSQYKLYRHLAGSEAETETEYQDNPDFNDPQQPLTGITPAQARAFCSWLSALSEERVRLPSEEEWEKAAKAGANPIFPWGNEAPGNGQRANYLGNPLYRSPSRAGSYTAGVNAWGLEDMAGNVWEIVTLVASESDIPVYAAKGGSWMEGPNDLRISNRRDINTDRAGADIGFRIIVEVEE